MEQEIKSNSIMLVKLVNGKVNTVQKFSLKEGSTLQPLLEQKSLINLQICSVDSVDVQQHITNKQVVKNVWRRCPCGMTFIYHDEQSSQNYGCAPSWRCRYCCKAFHDIKCLESHVESFHKTMKKGLPDICDDNVNENNSVTDCASRPTVPSATLLEKQNSKTTETDNPPGQYHRCHYCTQCFHHRTSLEMHLESVHKSIKSCPCGNCNSFFQGGSLEKVGNCLVDNKISNEKMKACRQRPRVFCSRKGKKPYQCSICLKKFARRGYMLEHESSHTGAKKVLCEICGKMIPSLRRLRDHFLNNHSERNIPCDFCGKLFDLRNLKRHLLVHTQEKPHHCVQCGKYFAREYTLMMHLRVHNNYKPHVCKICSKAFCQPTNLKTHMRNHGIFIRRRPKNEKKIFDELQKTVIPENNSG